MRERYEGGCHCGRVRFQATLDLARTVDCNCSICTKKGILHVIVPPADFEILRGRDELATYRFNTGVAQHTFCRHCGVHPFYVPRSHPDMIDINVRCLDGVDVGSLRAQSFDGRDFEAAIESRRAALTEPPRE